MPAQVRTLSSAILFHLFPPSFPSSSLLIIYCCCLIHVRSFSLSISFCSRTDSTDIYCNRGYGCGLQVQGVAREHHVFLIIICHLSSSLFPLSSLALLHHESLGASMRRRRRPFSHTYKRSPPWLLLPTLALLMHTRRQREKEGAHTCARPRPGPASVNAASVIIKR